MEGVQRRSWSAGVFWFALLAMSIAGASASAAEIKGFFPAAMRSAVVKLIPEFERATSNKVLVEYGAVGALTARLRKGEPGDLAILSEDQIDDLQKGGTVSAGTKVGIAKVGIGVFMANGIAKPDISSTEAFKRMLASAHSISFGNPANGAPAGVYIAKLIERLGLADDMRQKTVLATSGASLLESVASGNVEIGFNQITEIMVEGKKVQLVGPLPAEIQNYTRFAGALLATSNQKGAGTALLSYLSSPEALSVMRTLGLDPL
jgi:molybdate transport system substrate-binding protein